MNSAAAQYSFWQDYLGNPYSSTSNVESNNFRKATVS
jgi:hypothetical protein